MPVNPAATSIPKVPVEGPRAPGSDGGDKMTPGRRAAIPDPLALALARPPALGSGATAKPSRKRRLAEETAGSVGCSRDRILGEGGVPAAFRHVGRNCQAECGSAGLTGDHVTVSPRRPLTRRPGPRPEGPGPSLPEAVLPLAEWRPQAPSGGAVLAS